MPDTIWPLGTDASQKLRETLRDYLKAYLKTAPIKARLPKQFLTVLLEGERQTAGVFVIVATQPDNSQSWPYSSGANRVLEVPHKIALIVKSDAKSGGSASVLAVYSVLLAMVYNEIAREALRVLGVQNLSETAEGLEGDSGDANESITFRRQLDLRVTTDTFLT